MKKEKSDGSVERLARRGQRGRQKPSRPRAARGSQGQPLTETEARVLREITNRGKDGMRFCDIQPHEEAIIVTRILHKLRRRGLIEKHWITRPTNTRWRRVIAAASASDGDMARLPATPFKEGCRRRDKAGATSVLIRIIDWLGD